MDLRPALMHRLLPIVLVVLVIGCGHGDEGFKLIHVDDLVARRESPDASPTVLDANGADFRAREGIIPGAVLLSNYKTYDVAKELPPRKDARLVFYCADSHWMASHGAARRAVEAGYTDVAVMVDGLKGWRGSGKPTVKP